MKKRLTQTIILMLVGLATVSCIRHDCEYGDSAKFVYLKEPYTAQCYSNRKTYTIKAHVFMESDGGWIKKVTGTIPRAYQTGDTLNVKVSLEREPHANGWIHGFLGHDTLDPNGARWFYKITCIEKE